MVGRARGTVLTATRLILRRDGLRGLYRGFLLTFATYGPFSAIYFWSYDLFTRHMGQYPLINGTLAGAVAGVATQPVDWLKTRVQVSCGRRRVLVAHRPGRGPRRGRLGAVPGRGGARVLARGFLWDHDAGVRVREGWAWGELVFFVCICSARRRRLGVGVSAQLVPERMEGMRPIMLSRATDPHRARIIGAPNPLREELQRSRDDGLRAFASKNETAYCQAPTYAARDSGALCLGPPLPSRLPRGR